MAVYDIKADYDFFLQNKDKLCEEHPDKFVVIKNKEVIGVYDDQVSAYTETTKVHKPGTFIIDRCSRETSEAQVFHSRVRST